MLNIVAPMEYGTKQNAKIKNLSQGFPFPYTVHYVIDFNASSFL